MEKYKRICVIGLPRSGSNYVANIIEKSFLLSNGISYYNMGEPFTINQPYLTMLDDHKYIQCKNIESDQINNFVNFNHRMTCVLSSIEESNKNQSLLIRLFPMSYIISDLDIIISTLKNNGFDFIILKRNNVEEHLLSMTVASTTDKWISYDSSEVLNTSITIQNHGFQETHELYKYLKVYNSCLEMFNLHNSPTIYYETAVENLSEILQISIHNNVDLVKQLPLNPYNFITNAKEVKQFIEKLANDIRKEK